MSETQNFVIESGNDGGGARAIPAAGGGSRHQAVANVIQNVSGDETINHLPLVMGLQETTNIQRVTKWSDVKEADHPLEICRCLGELGVPTDYYSVPTVTMKHHPLEEKWKARWAEGILEMEQGGCTIAAKGARLQAPWIKTPWLGVSEDQDYGASPSEYYKAWKLDLPIHRTSDAVVALSTYYQGNRDTEPRAVTAHGVSLSDTTPARFIFLNLHLHTSKDEDVGTEKKLATDGEERTIRRASSAAIFLRRHQLCIIRDFIHEIAYGRLHLPVIVAGDFNAIPEAPELMDFMRSACLKPVFQSETCWKCRGPRDRTARPYFTSPNRKEILAETEAEVQAMGLVAVCISSDECCSNSKCGAPLFTHKRNFGLIDNILYTDAAALKMREDFLKVREDLAVQWRLDPDPDGNARGIRLDTYFSDHTPVWCKFSVARI